MGCIDALMADKKDKNELANNSIYLFEGNEEFEEVLRKGADYDFAVICANSDIGFIKKLKAVFEGGEFDKNEIVKIIECLPGRIIIVGEKPDSWDNYSSSENCEEEKGEEEEKEDSYFKKWLTKRICWVSKIDINNFNLKEDGNSIDVKNLSDKEKFKLKIYEIWVEHVRDEMIKCKDCKISLEGLDEFGKAGSGGLRERALANYKILVYMLMGIFPKVDQKILEFSVLAPLNGLCLLTQNECDSLRNDILIKLNCFKIEKVLVDITSEFKKYENCLYLKNDAFKLVFEENNQTFPVYVSQCIKDWIIFLTKIEDDCLNQEVQNNLEEIINDLKTPAFGENIASGSNNKFSLNNSNSNDIKISFKRHGEKLAKKEEKENIINFTDGEYYHENLSGSTVHLSLISSQLSGDSFNNFKIIYSLMENGLLRILVADERVARFVGQNPTARENLSVSGMDVVKSLDGLPLGENVKVNIGKYASGDAESYNSLKEYINAEVYHILIIHQGILDKIASEKPELSSPKKMEEVIQFWKERFFPYVIVTSGRGTPANVPENAKFIPFSIVETTLMKQYHEKYILTKILMKSLPARR